jgi:hypothetical protein
MQSAVRKAMTSRPGMIERISRGRNLLPAFGVLAVDENGGVSEYCAPRKNANPNRHLDACLRYA